ncbi:hypothetical protein [Subtercola endophyticus]|uniref:hypothetical protein n=1 Tax=Subtercola endophyticus TaxID=2895559 RepID=UPI001E4832B0|nr:hypothetical protein [Subtercola endophyticus]UFS59864.1 hypothetical protein LQ955_03455 [Subtercola endophyticus]
MMHVAAAHLTTAFLWLADDSTPTPSVAPTPDPDSVTPGILGFVITLGVTLGAVALIIDMVRRIRRVNLRQQAKEKVDAEVAAAAAAAGRSGGGKRGGSIGGARSGGGSALGGSGSGGSLPPDDDSL